MGQIFIQTSIKNITLTVFPVLSSNEYSLISFTNNFSNQLLKLVFQGWIFGRKSNFWCRAVETV